MFVKKLPVICRELLPFDGSYSLFESLLQAAMMQLTVKYPDVQISCTDQIESSLSSRQNQFFKHFPYLILVK